MEGFEELNLRRAIINSIESSEEAGGQNKKTKARKRIESLLDDNSFVEIGALSQSKGAGVITGYGTINNRLAYVYSQDIAKSGGIMNRRNYEKILNILELSLKMGAPVIQILDSVGGDMEEGLQLLSYYSSIFNVQAKLTGVVPQISVICGSCVGAAALSACISDVVIMTREGELALNSAERIERVSGTYSDLKAYAKGDSAGKSGSAEIVVETEEEALEMARRVLSYLPHNNYELPSFQVIQGEESLSDEIDSLYIDGKLTYKELLESIADRDSLLEIDNRMGAKIYTGFIKLRGLTLGVIASKDSEKGYISIKDCEKAVRFIKICNAFNISILSLTDCKGFLPSNEEEAKGEALYASRLLYVLAQASVPKVALIIGDSIGLGHIVFASKGSFDMCFALPATTIAVAEPTEIVKQLYREEIASDPNPKEKEKQFIQKYLSEEATPFKAVEEGIIDDVIKPSEARVTLIKTFDMLQSKRELKYHKKHESGLI